MPWRARYFLIGAVALCAVAGVIGWQFFDRRGEVLRPDGGPVVTVMDWTKLPARSAPLWLATSEILDTIADERVLYGKGRGAEHAVRNP